MKFNKWLLIGLFLFAVVSLGAVSANENVTQETAEQNVEDVSYSLQVNGTGEEVHASIDEDDLTASGEDMPHDNVTVEVSDVFEGQNATISVKVAEATGTVNIIVGENLYTPEFVGGVATQSISKYSIGLNNVTVKYNNIVKQTSFKVLDGVITNGTFEDYFEIESGYYQLRSFIPEGITLDFRGYIYRNNKINGANEIRINKPYNITSTTGDAEIRIYLRILNNSSESNISNIKFYKLGISASNCTVMNSSSLSISYTGNNFKLEDSIVDTLNANSNSIIINCTINNQWYLKSKSTDNLNNVSVFNSTFNNGIHISVYETFNKKFTYPIGNLTLMNCIINGKTDLSDIKNSLIQNCIFYNVLLLGTRNCTVKNNFFNVSSSTYAIIIDHRTMLMSGIEDRQDNKIICNRIYSRDYCGNNSIAYQSGCNISNYPELANIFENNTPTQTDLNIGIMYDTIFYDENTTVLVNMPGIEGNVVFYLNNQKISTVKLIDGVATQTIDKYELGINNVAAVYEDLLNDIYGVNHTSFNVKKVNRCPINLVYDEVCGEKPFIVNVTLPNDANGTMTFVLSNGSHSIIINQDAMGANNIINVPALFEGNYTMSVTFESIKYVTNSAMGNINVVHIPVYKLTAKNMVMDYKDGSKYKVLITKDGKAVGAGEVVEITFNGKTNNVKTDKNGYATFTLDASPKTYTIKAAYNGVTKSNKVTIKNVLKAKNISKKKAKIIKFSATLKTSKGKVISSKKITFKLKGKTYTAKTNKKGVATISIKNLKVGKYTVTSKYEACAVKSTITIKK